MYPFCILFFTLQPVMVRMFSPSMSLGGATQCLLTDCWGNVDEMLARMLFSYFLSWLLPVHLLSSFQSCLLALYPLAQGQKGH